jgi:anti-sigma B factor antagonist
MNSIPTFEPAGQGHLRIELAPDAEGLVVALAGELDLASVPELDQCLQELTGTDPGRLLIDLSGLDFMDSTGLALMVRAHRSAETNGHSLALRRGPAQVQRLFELTRLVDHFTFED